MSYPILYDSAEIKFDHNGYGILSSCIVCQVTEESNGMYELYMQYPIDGIHCEEIGGRSIIKAMVDNVRDPQLFRVYAINKSMNGIVDIYASHISYDLTGIPVKPFSAKGAKSAFQGLSDNVVVDSPFTFWTDIESDADFSVSVPSSIRSCLGGIEGSFLDTYGGEYEFDNYAVKAHKQRGKNRGVSIRYGKNLTDIGESLDCENIATGVYPYWVGEIDESTVFVELPERILNAPGAYMFSKIRILDLSGEFDEQPTIEQLRKAANDYISKNNIQSPSFSITVSFAQLQGNEEYKGIQFSEYVGLFDEVQVEFPILGITATAMAVKIVYDSILEKPLYVTLGSVRKNIATTIANQSAIIKAGAVKIAKYQKT